MNEIREFMDYFRTHRKKTVLLTYDDVYDAEEIILDITASKLDVYYEFDLLHSMNLGIDKNSVYKMGVHGNLCIIMNEDKIKEKEPEWLKMVDIWVFFGKIRDEKRFVITEYI